MKRLTAGLLVLALAASLAVAPNGAAQDRPTTDPARLAAPGPAHK